MFFLDVLSDFADALREVGEPVQQVVPVGILHVLHLIELRVHLHGRFKQALDLVNKLRSLKWAGLPYPSFGSL